MNNKVNVAEMMEYLPPAVKDGLHKAAKEAGQKTDDLEMHRRCHSEKAQVNQIDPKCRKALKYVSTRTWDRDDEIVIPSGIDLSEFKKYKHVLVNHNYSLLPIGSDEWIEADDFGIKAMTMHADTGEGTLANVIWHLVRQGHLKASSIGFVPLSATKPGHYEWDAVANKLQRDWKEFDKEAAQKGLSRIVTKGMLLEHSYVSVPCNPDAEMIQVVKGLNIKDDKIFKKLGWKTVEDEGILVPKREVIVIKSEGVVPVKKGESDGHPFRGNQHTSGEQDGVPAIDGTASVEEQRRQLAAARASYNNPDSNYHKLRGAREQAKADRLAKEQLQAKNEKFKKDLQAKMEEISKEGSNDPEGNTETEEILDTLYDLGRTLQDGNAKEIQASLDSMPDFFKERMEPLFRSYLPEWGKTPGPKKDQMIHFGRLLREYSESAEVPSPDLEKRKQDYIDATQGKSIKVLSTPVSIKVLYTPPTPKDLEEVTDRAIEKALKRSLGKLV